LQEEKLSVSRFQVLLLFKTLLVVPRSKFNNRFKWWIIPEYTILMPIITLKNIIKFGGVGGSYRDYQLNSHGRIYTDVIVLLNIVNADLYAVAEFMEDRFKFTGIYPL
jgi:hypothetical protein